MTLLPLVFDKRTSWWCTSITLAGSLMTICKRAKASRMHVRLNSA